MKLQKHLGNYPSLRAMVSAYLGVETGSKPEPVTDMSDEDIEREIAMLQNMGLLG